LIFYLDSSVAVAAVSSEPATAAAHQWLAAAEVVLMSDWTLTEAAAGLSQKQRMRVISAEEHKHAAEALHRQLVEAYEVVPVTRQDFRLAARFAGRAETGLRAGDGLHLAIASAAGAKLVTLDKKQAHAGEMLQVPTLLLAAAAPSR
jgi:predicted nucleic acid-binding protein